MPIGKTFHALSQSGTGGQADFTVDFTTIEPSDTVQFTDLTTDITPTSWQWDFGDGETSTLQNPTHRYKFSGQFTVTLIASDGTTTVFEEKQAYIDCSSPDWIVTIDTRITYDPIRNRTAFTQADNEFRLQINSGILGGGLSSATCDIDWGDGIIETVPLGTANSGVTGIVHTYATPGIYKVKLMAISNRPVAPQSWDTSGGNTEARDNSVKIIEFNNWGSGISYISGSSFSAHLRNWRVVWYANDKPANSTNISGSGFMTDTSWELTSQENGCYPDHIFSGFDPLIISGDRVFNGAGFGFNPDMSKLTLNYSSFAAQGCRETFDGCSMFNQPLSHWILTNVGSTSAMFRGCSRFNQDISMWDVSNVTNMSGMFNGARSFNQDISSWNVGSVTSAQGIFIGARSFNQDISSWDVNNVSDFRQMFDAATNFNQNLGSWQLRTAGTNFQTIFRNSGMSTENYTDTIVGWANYVQTNGGPSNVNMTAQTGMVFTNSRPGGSFADAQAARAYLATQGWTISGDTVVA